MAIFILTDIDYIYDVANLGSSFVIPVVRNIRTKALLQPMTIETNLVIIGRSKLCRCRDERDRADDTGSGLPSDDVLGYRQVSTHSGRTVGPIFMSQCSRLDYPSRLV